MVSVDVGLQWVAALATATVALLVATNAAAGRPRIYLAAFLILLSVNHFAEAARGAGFGDARAAYRLASVAAALDPLALTLFVASYLPKRSNRVAPPALAGGAVLALWAGWALDVPGPTWSWFGIVLAIYTTIVYGALLAHVLASRSTDGAGVRGWLVAPLVVAWLPTLPRAVDATFLPLDVSYIGQPVLYAALFAFRILCVVAATWYLRHRFAGVSHEQAWLARLALVLAIFLVSLAELRNAALSGAGLGIFGPPSAALSELGRGAAALRWLLFGALALGAIERAAPRSSARASRLVGRGVIGLAIFVLGSVSALLVASFIGTTFSVLSAPVLAIAVAVALSQAFRDAVDRMAWRVTGHSRAPAPADRSLYSAAALQALTQGRDLRRDAALEAMRTEMRIPLAEAEGIARALEGSHGPPLQEGLLAFGRYRVDRFLGRGGQGRTFVARDLELGRVVVLKELADGETRAEAQLAARVDHPNVVRIFDVATRGGRGLIVMEYVEGGSLGDRLRAQGRVDDPMGFARAFLSGLAAIHAAGIVHGDLKPANILLDRDGQPRIADFGLAQARLEETATLGEAVAAGTPRFMAPELASGARATKRSDVFAAGLVLRAASGDDPHPAMAQAIRRACAADPATRFADASEMLATLALDQRQ